MIERTRDLPVIMPAGQFAEALIATIQTTVPGDSVGISTMQLAPQPGRRAATVETIANELLVANDRGVAARLSIDASYVGRLTRIGNRDFPDGVPLLTAAARRERNENRRAADELLARLAMAGILAYRGARPMLRDYTPRLRYNGSQHVLQRWAARHAKAAHVVKGNGDATAWITSANFTDSDLTDPTPSTDFGMNNLAFRVEGNLARFVIRSLEDGFGHTAGTHRYQQGGVTIIHDINNAGEPGRLPTILQRALIAIDPRRDEVITDPTVRAPKSATHAVLLSQYLPDGLLYSALERVAKHADVYVPKQPANDHRAKSFPYNIHSYAQGKKLAESDIATSRRSVPSHVKALLVTYDDGTARIIGGTDNFATHLQKFVRNEELAIVIDLDLKDDATYGYYQGFVSLLHAMGEIPSTVHDSLLASA